jgi:hypothetical protein
MKDFLAAECGPLRAAQQHVDKLRNLVDENAAYIAKQTAVWQQDENEKRALLEKAQALASLMHEKDTARQNTHTAIAREVYDSLAEANETERRRLEQVRARMLANLHNAEDVLRTLQNDPSVRANQVARLENEIANAVADIAQAQRLLAKMRTELAQLWQTRKNRRRRHRHPQGASSSPKKSPKRRNEKDCLFAACILCKQMSSFFSTTSSSVLRDSGLSDYIGQLDAFICATRTTLLNPTRRSHVEHSCAMLTGNWFNCVAYCSARFLLRLHLFRNNLSL